MNKFLLRYCCCLVLLIPAIAKGQFRLPAIIRDSMVLQRNKPIKLWGWATPGQKVVIVFRGNKTVAKTASNGRWTAALPAREAGGPYEMQFIAGAKKQTLRNILLGDVWLCSGQSNMVHQMELHQIRYDEDVKTAHYPEIRQFWIPQASVLTGPAEDLIGGNWKAANPEDVKKFSAVAYFFARKIYERYHVPIGIINASVGGSPIEAWMSKQALQAFPDAAALLKENEDTAKVFRINREAAIARQQQPAVPDNGMNAAVKWYDPVYTPKGWSPITVPGFWEGQGLGELDGIVWYRRTFTVPDSLAGKPARLLLGRIVDADAAYINGQLVGTTGYQYPQRRYAVKEGVIKAGENLLVVKITNTAGKGGFVPDKPYFLQSGNTSIDLKGTWQYKVGAAFPPAAPIRSIALQNQPAALYNGMLAPIVFYGIAGFLWYQGESNAGNPSSYGALMKAMIMEWRAERQDNNLPFLFAQLPNFGNRNYLPGESNWAELRQQQWHTLTVPHTGMAVTIDAGEWNDIHPDDKKDVGDRLALLAMKQAYHDTSIVANGPVVEAASADDGKIVLDFSTALTTNDGEAPACFAVAGADKKFEWATGVIEGKRLILHCNKVSKPVFVRYAWADNPYNANLFCPEGLPATPFEIALPFSNPIH
ncbi:MAG: sialate O-acetylesterase [Bacteroidota bacterium]|nr:sialate O-acetylesterase [Bacteroidota bacterium]